jgi:hypothetical protein
MNEANYIKDKFNEMKKQHRLSFYKNNYNYLQLSSHFLILLSIKEA